MENSKATCEMLLQSHERKSFLYRIVTKNGFILKTRSGKNYGFHLAKPILQRQGEIASARKPCFVSAKPGKDTLKSLGCDILPHPDLAASEYHLFASMGHAFSQQHFRSFEEVGKRPDEGGGLMAWVGITLDDHTYRYVLTRNTETVVKCSDEILEPFHGCSWP
ncbi:hypothetical protein TNCV_2206911 [Trichonephila clavipes]|uniref:Uncharacterized protein n=1 Tax=Trichonephila clavipes TaxID=2585209 RepID=A0A8X6S5Y9_TRICX|nr:hypothetical protein TNCV_2206911 [Trichonephila clavipes]